MGEPKVGSKTAPHAFPVRPAICLVCVIQVLLSLFADVVG